MLASLPAFYFATSVCQHQFLLPASLPPPVPGVCLPATLSLLLATLPAPIPAAWLICHLPASLLPCHQPPSIHKPPFLYRLIGRCIAHPLTLLAPLPLLSSPSAFPIHLCSLSACLTYYSLSPLFLPPAKCAFYCQVCFCCTLVLVICSTVSCSSLLSCCLSDLIIA